MNNRTSLTLAAAVSAIAFLSAAPAEIQDPFRKQMLIFMKAVSDAKTDAEREAVQAKIREFETQWKAAHPDKSPTAAEQAERGQKMQERLKNDPDQWQLYQLEQSMSRSTATAERVGIEARMKALHEKIQADQDAKLTPQEKAARKPQEEKLAAMNAELAPLIQAMQNTTTDAEKIAIRAQMDEVMKKYRRGAGLPPESSR